jgi:hypothetical protein
MLKSQEHYEIASSKARNLSATNAFRFLAFHELIQLRGRANATSAEAKYPANERGRASRRNRSPQMRAPIKFRSRKTFGEWLSQLIYRWAAHCGLAFPSMTSLSPPAGCAPTISMRMHSPSRFLVHSIVQKSRCIHTIAAIKARAKATAAHFNVSSSRS